GVATWGPNGVVVCDATFDQLNPSVCRDGNGGAIVAWRDQRSGVFDIYAQRLDANGAPQWTAGGVAVCVVVNNQYNPVLVSDDAGGAIVIWYDYRALNYDIYAQRLDADGTPLWTAGGIAIYAGAHNQYNPMAVADGSGGAVVAWTDIRNGNADIFARRVTGAGTMQWTPSGVPLCTNAIDQLDPVLVNDGTGGAIVAWRDARNGNWDIFAQRADNAGTTLWTANGVAVCSATADQLHPAVACDGAGGAVVAWDDARGLSADIYAQRLSAGGVAQWAADGVAVCNAPFAQTRPTLVCDGAGNAIVAWEDRRSVTADIFAQRIGPAGAGAWTANGIALCSAAGEQTVPLASPDGAGGIDVVWADTRGGNVDLYANRVGNSGGTPTGVGGPAGAPGLVVSRGYPNPFARAVRFDIEAGSQRVTMEVFDVAGRRVAVREARAGGILFDARDNNGRLLPAGVYLCRFTAGGATQTRKIVVTR
ncbi:MAG: T9SS type A sorting domain-containing protein, partial [Candidatus Krumholzibacteria bacterium]|nr:T9SS type A sorting domain-containing protein [Candidatus Krumholzibacteria bacterium]